jgi:hypothetical protein
VKVLAAVNRLTAFGVVIGVRENREGQPSCQLALRPTVAGALADALANALSMERAR